MSGSAIPQIGQTCGAKPAGQPESKLVLTSRMIKLSHSVFALPFALIAVFLASQAKPSKLPHLAAVAAWLVCMVSARAFAMTFNRIADYRLDSLNPRTMDRELPSGKLSLKFAYILLGTFSAVLVLAASVFYFLYSNYWPVVLSPALLAFLAAYSYSKRFTVLCHFWLGASLGLAPVASWIAMSPPEGPVIAWPAVMLGIAVTFWTAGFDIIYSLADIDFDRRNGVLSIAARFGTAKALNVSRFCHLITIAVLASLILLPGFGRLYAAALTVSAEPGW
jgi:4-hydroxybenzoate polyprenyltransferase